MAMIIKSGKLHFRRIVLREAQRLRSTTSPSSNNTILRPAFFKPRLVIFDKDGTLVCFHTMWTPWCTSLAQRLQHVTGFDLADPLFDVLGYDHSNRKVRIGALAENTHPQIRTKIEDMLQRHKGYSKREAQYYVNKSWRDTPENMEIKLTGNLRDMFETLQRENIKIAICTSDSREGTMEFLERERLQRLVDKIVCGDDHNTKPKPDPHNAHYICKELDVKPSDAIMVGDTPADTLMGQQANLGLTVGVLTGVGSEEDLADADVIVRDVHECVNMILPSDSEASIRRRVHQVTTRGLAKIAQGAWWHHNHQTGRFGSNPGERLFSTSSQVSKSSSEYSHIVVGAGSAGCVLANRLTEDQNSVLLIEAGPKDTIWNSKALSWKIHMPAALMYNLCDDKFYHTLPQEHMNNRVMYWPRGRVWGGSSSLNAMVYIRGHAFDYDRWEKQGAVGWNYFNCLPYFKKAQCHQLGGDLYRGGNGPLHVSMRNWDNPLHHVFLEAGQQAGHPFSSDVNGYQQEGVSWFDMTIYQGRRWSAASAYLRPALERSNLTTKENTMVLRVIFEGKRAVGLELADGEKIYADKIVLSGGAINSPQLLMLSGIGDADHLRDLNIPVVEHVPGVGRNLQDHLEIYVVQKSKKPVSLLSDQKGVQMIKTGVKWFLNQTGPARTAHLESGGFCHSRSGLDHPDIMFHFLPSQVIDHGRQTPKDEAFQVHVGPMRPTSVGWMKLKSSNPKEHPIIQPNYLETEIDRWEMRQSIRLAREIFAQPAFDEYRAGELEPGSHAQSDEDLDEVVRNKADSAYHPSCTCRMGRSSDNRTVVDSDTMKVVGLDNLYVVDASVMPSIVSGNLNAPTIMLAERAADIVRRREMLPKEVVPVYNKDKKKPDKESILI